MRPSVVGPLALACALPALAQQSASYRLEEHVLHAGGRPDQGTVAASSHFRVTLDAVGQGVSGTGTGSLSFAVDAGFLPAYLPPGEVTGVLFADKQTLVWAPEISVGDYNLYRDGLCQAQNLLQETASDAQVPAAGANFSYLVTAENRLDEEGTRGVLSDGTERTGTPCP